jgi:hypothetical protein
MEVPARLLLGSALKVEVLHKRPVLLSPWDSVHIVAIPWLASQGPILGGEYIYCPPE